MNKIYMLSDEEALPLLKLLAENNDAESQYFLGLLLRKKDRGWSQDIPKANYWLRKYAEQGNTDAKRVLDSN